MRKTKRHSDVRGAPKIGGYNKTARGFEFNKCIPPQVQEDLKNFSLSEKSSSSQNLTLFSSFFLLLLKNLNIGKET